MSPTVDGALPGRCTAGLDLLVPVSAILATGWPTRTAGTPFDPWPFLVASALVCALHHLRLPACPAPQALRQSPGPALLILGAVAAGLCLDRGRLVMADDLVRLWILFTAHWALLARYDLEGYTSRAASLVPVTFLPLVLCQAVGIPPATSGAESALIALGHVLHRLGGRIRRTEPGTRCLAVLRWLPLSLPLLAAAGLLLDLGIPTRGRVLFDDAHDSAEPPGLGLARNEIRPAPPPGHGSLLDLCRSSGYQTSRIVTPLTTGALDGASVLALLMNRRPLAPAERARILSFVEEGGGLLVVGDHTDVDGTSSAVAPLLEALGVRLRFDTVWRRPDAVPRDVRVLAHPLTLGLPRLHLSAGCSLEPAGLRMRPFVVAGPGLFSDAGDLAADARLGDGLHQHDEPVGDLVLAATGTRGLGRFAVLGDSSYLQNSVTSVNRTFAQRLFWWLSRREPWPTARILLLTVALVVLVPLTLLAAAPRPADGGPIILLGAVVLSMLVATGEARALGRLCTPPDLPGPDVVVDLAHDNRVAFFFARGIRTRDRDSMDVWLREVEARGHAIAFHDRADGPLGGTALAAAKILVIVHPLADYAPGELAAVRSFVERGGGLLVMVGPDPGGRVSNLLPALGLQAALGPLGLQAPALFAGEFPVRSAYGEGTYPEATVRAPSRVTTQAAIVPVDPVQVGGGDPIATAFDRPVAVGRILGRGRIVLLGDREFFTDFAFVDTQNHRVDLSRVAFLDDLLRHLRGGAP